jgi:hypothetical protein
VDAFRTARPPTLWSQLVAGSLCAACLVALGQVGVAVAQEQQAPAQEREAVAREGAQETAGPVQQEADPALQEQAVDAAGRPIGQWVDTGHAYATNRAQALAQWMDDFFGAPIADAERANSFVRTIIVDDWDQRDGHDFKFRVRGQVNLPKISSRADLIFSGEEAEQTLTEEERSQENDVGLRFNFRDSNRTRFDATLSLRSGPAILPGVRFRYQQPITDNSWGRFTQRLQYHSEDGYRAISNVDLNRALGERSLIRWGARLRYREDKDFWDWNTGITYRRWFADHKDFPSALEYYVAVSGRDQPETFETNYRIGVLYRKQFFREFLFYEIEPNYNWRRDTYEEKRSGVLGIVLRLEVMLDESLIRARRD